MSTQEEQIVEIEKEIRETPYHKGTERHIGLLRARLAILKDKVVESQTRKSGGGGGYAVKKQGDATIVLVGPPSAGKSTLLNALTNAESKVAPYAFTTVSVIPGMMKYKHAAIQILDVPGLIEGAEEGKGRGREVLSVVRGADLLILMSDVARPEALERIAEALERNGIRVNKQPPRIRVEKKLSGGLIVHTNLVQTLSKETVKDVASHMGIKNAEIYVTEILTMERLIDAFAKNRVYIPALFVLNKADITTKVDLPQHILNETLFISATNKLQLDQFKTSIWEKLGFATVYLVRGDEEPHTGSPLVVKRDQTLQEIAESIGTEFAAGKTKAKIWGNGARFAGQEVSFNSKIADGMQIRFV